MKNQIKNLAQEPLERRTAPFAGLPVDQTPVEDAPIDSGGGGTTTPAPLPEPPVDYPGKSDNHRQDIFNKNN
jgi:hypothetical protein